MLLLESGAGLSLFIILLLLLVCLFYLFKLFVVVLFVLFYFCFLMFYFIFKSDLRLWLILGSSVVFANLFLL